MRKLPLPSFDFATTFTKTLDGIGKNSLKNKYLTQITNVKSIEDDYIKNAKSSSLYTLPRIRSGRGVNPIVHGTLKKSDLAKLYTQYFACEGKPARDIYDGLKVTTNGKCPFCGEIGHVRTLDHFIPKANFPLYSVLPVNLVPCCRDCNSDKLNTFSETLDNQTLHPYFDDDKYFTQKWVEARVVPGDPPVLEYYVSPPENWEKHEKSRVTAHFIEYGLAKRFGIEAGADIPETIYTRKNILYNQSPEEYSEYLREKSNNSALSINNWRRVMFASLANDSWFCSHNH